MKKGFVIGGAFLLSMAMFRFSPFAGIAAAATYYVSPSGGDFNNGSLSAPFKTIQHAADIARPGDIVIVKDGTYTGGSGPNSYIVRLLRSGTPSSPITFESENKWGAVLDGRNNSTEFCFQIGYDGGPPISYINIENFEIKGCGIDGNSSSGIFIPHRETVSHLTIRGNKIHDINRQRSANSDAEGIMVSEGGNHITMDGNVIYNIGRLPHSYFTSYDYNHDHAIYDEGSNDVIMNNIFYNNTSGWDIQIKGPGANWMIINNEFDSINPFFPGNIVWDVSNGNMGPVTIENNIFYRNTVALDTYAGNGGSAITFNNNILNGTVMSGRGSWNGCNNLYMNPLLVKPPSDVANPPGIGARQCRKSGKYRKDPTRIFSRWPRIWRFIKPLL